MAKAVGVPSHCQESVATTEAKYTDVITDDDDGYDCDDGKCGIVNLPTYRASNSQSK